VPAEIKGPIAEKRLERWKHGPFEIMPNLARQYKEQGL